MQNIRGLTSVAYKQLMHSCALKNTHIFLLQEAKWQMLPYGYWPPYYAASFCNGNGCSLPPGLTCEPVIRLVQKRLFLKKNKVYNKT